MSQEPSVKKVARLLVIAGFLLVGVGVIALVVIGGIVVFQYTRGNPDHNAMIITPAIYVAGFIGSICPTVAGFMFAIAGKIRMQS